MDVEVLIVGGGVGGAALGDALAAAGRSVAILERSERFEDVVRGEWISPWGVVEVKTLGLYDVLLGAGGHHLATHLSYDETLDVAAARAAAIPLSSFRPGVPGPICIGHPRLCQTLLDLAAKRGARVERGVSDVRISAGPEVRYARGGAAHSLRAELVVGADGRASSVRRQLGLAVREGPPHHLFAGLLVEGADAWPADLQATATEGDVAFLARLYAGYAREQSGRFAGSEGAARFVDACVLDCVPESAAFRSARPAGPCRSYANQDTWLDRPFAPGAILVGDAAGYPARVEVPREGRLRTLRRGAPRAHAPPALCRRDAGAPFGRVR
jgi:2-polyprenyl-6-methoxyphenol hydroxylase-like FAD-dependent oxidoreductase